jgi:spermidine/putrescine transport system permease protein
LTRPSLATLFVQLRFHEGMLTVIAAEEAAQDLGAGPWETFRLVTLPMITPGVVAGALLAFALSIDDFITTEFTSGSFMTCPPWIWSVSRQGLPPQADVMGSIIFLGGARAAGGWALFQRRRA